MKNLLSAALLGGMTSCGLMAPADTTVDGVLTRNVDFFCSGLGYTHQAFEAGVESDSEALEALLEGWKTNGGGCAYFTDIFHGAPGRGVYSLVEAIGDTDWGIYTVTFPNGLGVYTFSKIDTGA